MVRTVASTEYHNRTELSVLMVCKEIEFTFFRNIESEKISFSDGINVIYGENAQGKTNILEGIYLFARGKSFRAFKDKELINFDADEAHIKTIINKKDIKDSHVEKVLKAYPSYFDTYYEIDKLINYLNKYNNLYCIGRNGQHHYNNMDHSVATAFEAVNNILNNISNKENIWSVNTEKDYHEEKNK